MPSRTSPSSRVVLALLVLGACASTRESSAERVEDLIAHHRYADAVAEAANNRAEHPRDPRAEELHRKASVAYLLETGRELTFADRDVEALEKFADALEIDPTSQAVLDWIQKTKLKLAERWIEAALELHANDDLEAAVEAYEHALKLSPGDPSAINGLASAVIQINYRSGLGKRYFEEGLHALADYWLEHARSRFSYSNKYLETDDRPGQRRRQVDKLLAQQRAAVGAGFEKEKRFAAARNEYRLALALDPDNVEAQGGIERAKKEARAAQLLENAQMEVVRRRFEQAQAQLDEAEQLSTEQKELIDGARARVEEARYSQLYDEALALERDYAYEEAIAKYEALLALTPYFKDVLARKDTLAGYVKLAADLYAQSEAAATDAEKLELLRQIHVFWPEYKDIADRIAALEKVAGEG